jgi:chromosome segregation ATPase
MKEHQSMDVESNLKAIGSAIDATQSVSAAIQEAKTNIEAAQAGVSAAVSKAAEALTNVVNVIELANSETQSAARATEEHTAATMALQHHGEVGHLQEAETELHQAEAQHVEAYEYVQTLQAALNEFKETAANALAGIGSGLDEPVTKETTATQAIETAQLKVVAVGESR